MTCHWTTCLQDSATVSKASRTAVVKMKSHEYLPMRFKGDSLAVARVHSYDRQHYYMQVSIEISLAPLHCVILNACIMCE